MERLRDFTENALQRMESKRRTQIESEMASNEEKLRHTRLIKDDNNELCADTILEAEFMPGPGSVKYRDSWISKGIFSFFNNIGVLPPWGGRFKISQSSEKKVIIIIYLF